MHDDFAENVLKYFIACDSSTVPRKNIVKRHRGDGDYSFPIEALKWQKDEKPYTGIPTRNQQSNYADQFHQAQIIRLIEHSQQWSFPIERGTIQRDRCVLYLNRYNVFRHHLVTTNPQSGRKSDWDSIDTSAIGLTITDYRQELVGRVLFNLLEYSTLPVDSRKIAKIQSIKCGVAMSPNADIVTVDQYIQKRCADAQLKAPHKYDEQKYELLRKVGLASVTFDLLEVKYSSPVILSLTNYANGRSASFIMYNSARIETLCSKFDDRIRQGYYPQMPNLEDIDVTVLTDKYEWALMFHYIAYFPNMISHALGDSETASMAPHSICMFLIGLASCFSIYYQHCKILTENRENLLPSLYARMALIKCLRIVLNKGMALLNIEPVEHM